jgi:acyl-coenzyme A thioesterase PaaI-like protein
VTLEMKINFLLPVKGDVIYGEGRVIHKGTKFAVPDVEVKDSSGRTVAKALVTCAGTSLKYGKIIHPGNRPFNPGVRASG